MGQKLNIFWFRRDLRIADNTGLFHALNSNYPVLPLFIFDTEILNHLEDKNDRRISFIYDELLKIKSKFEKVGSSLLIEYGNPFEVFQKLITTYKIAGVFCNHDYEPYAIYRDKEIEDWLFDHGIEFNSYKDHVIFERDDILKKDGSPYTVFTPYMKQWKKQFKPEMLQESSSEDLLNNLIYTSSFKSPVLSEIGFDKTDYLVHQKHPDINVLKKYTEKRNIPSENGTSNVSVHLRFGTVSIRKMVKLAVQHNESWLNELIWREFFMMTLWNFPQVIDQSFRKNYDRIKWRNNENEFNAWCNGKTGFPIVDAGMRELNQTGYMHNRVRMIVAGFLVKDLLVDWRWGEAYFAKKLMDYELSSNNGNWQWVAGTGCDAAPYFRVFNPQLQQERFDPNMKYIKKWIPELNTSEYPKPIVDHKYAKERTINAYKDALNTN